METSLTVEVPVRVLAEFPPAAGDHPPILIALHGYAQTASMMLPLAKAMAPEGFFVVVVEGPHSTLVEGPTGDVEPQRAFHWGVSPRVDENRATHRACVTAAIRWAEWKGGDPKRVSIAGFSQPTSFDYRLALDPPFDEPLRAVVGICGGLPGEWLGDDDRPSGTAASRETAALHVATRDDEFYSLARVAPFEAHLAKRFRTAEVRYHDGGHRIPKDAIPAIREFLSKNG